MSHTILIVQWGVQQYCQGIFGYSYLPTPKKMVAPYFYFAKNLTLNLFNMFSLQNLDCVQESARRI